MVSRIANGCGEPEVRFHDGSGAGSVVKETSSVLTVDHNRQIEARDILQLRLSLNKSDCTGSWSACKRNTLKIKRFSSADGRGTLFRTESAHCYC